MKLCRIELAWHIDDDDYWKYAAYNDADAQPYYIYMTEYMAERLAQALGIEILNEYGE